MQQISFLLSICLHVLLFGFIAFWVPASKHAISLNTYQVSLVAGSLGGEDLASPILGKRPPEINTEKIEIAEDKKKTPPDIPEKAVPIVEKPVEIQKEKPTPKKTKKEETPKAPPKAKEAKPKNSSSKKEDSSEKIDGDELLKSVLAEVQETAGIELPTSAALEALTDLEKRVGGGAGLGDGDGGGAINNVYSVLVMAAIQPNWSTATYSRTNLVVQVRIEIDKQGKILNTKVEKSSGRADFDASAINAVLRTEYLPPPPTIKQQTILISFNSLEMGAL